MEEAVLQLTKLNALEKLSGVYSLKDVHDMNIKDSELF
jgi:hypothetical protein